MKKLIILLSINTVLFLSCSNEINNNAPIAKNGILDLRNWDLKKDGPVKLDGEWNFFWKKIVPPEKIKKEITPYKIKIPGVWHSQKINDKYLDRHGYATYHLKILLDPIDTPLAIKFPTIGSAFEAYINGKKINTVGKVGKTYETMRAVFRPEVVHLIDLNDELNFVIHVSSFHQKYAGLWYSLYLGQSTDLEKIRYNNIFLTVFLVGVFIIMFFYHIGIYLLRKQEPLPLYFAIFCLLLSIRILSYGEILLLTWFPQISMGWLKTIEYTTYYLSIPTGCMFLYKLFPEESNKKIFIILNAPIILITIITIFTPMLIFTFLIGIVQLLTLLTFIYTIYLNIYAVLKKRDGSLILLIGFISLTLFATIDIINAVLILNLSHLTPYGLLILIFCQAYILSTKSSRAYFTVERLTSTLQRKNMELKDLNIHLEKKVDDRTKELVEANSEISTINKNLIKTKNELWGEMEVAKKIQTVLLPKQPSIPGFLITSFMLPADEIGGDYYDIINTEKNDWILIGDVSGHGVPAGLIMMMVQSAVRTHIMSNPTIKPSTLLENINTSMSYNIDNMNEQKFMTLTALSYNKENEIIFSGRHEDILVYRSNNDKVEVIKTAGICISKMLLGEKDINLKIDINQGDTILLFTDGLIEAWDDHREDDENKVMFGQEKLINILKEEGKNTPEVIQEKILIELKGYSLEDDISLIILKKL